MCVAGLQRTLMSFIITYSGWCARSLFYDGVKHKQHDAGGKNGPAAGNKLILGRKGSSLFIIRAQQLGPEAACGQNNGCKNNMTANL